MLLFVPTGIGIAVGIIIIALTIVFKRMFNVTVAKIPSFLGVIAAIIIFCMGYVEVRGWEGAAYLYLAFTIFVFLIITFFIATFKRTKSSRNSHF